jgi:hypothetical protein
MVVARLVNYAGRDAGSLGDRIDVQTRRVLYFAGSRRGLARGQIKLRARAIKRLH